MSCDVVIVKSDHWRRLGMSQRTRKVYRKNKYVTSHMCTQTTHAVAAPSLHFCSSSKGTSNYMSHMLELVGVLRPFSTQIWLYRRRAIMLEMTQTTVGIYS